MRRAALVLTAAALGLFGVAVAVARTQALPKLFSRQIHAINAAAKAPPVLLPRSMPLDARHLYPSGGPSGRSYELELGAVRGCDGANACLVADFTAARARTVFGRKVTVRGASKAGFIPLSCGASCSPPQIDFIVHGIRYVIQANLTSKHGDRAALIAAARSAISAGPR